MLNHNERRIKKVGFFDFYQKIYAKLHLYPMNLTFSFQMQGMRDHTDVDLSLMNGELCLSVIALKMMTRL